MNTPLRSVMARLRLSQQRMVRELGVSKGSVLKWCQGEAMPRAETALELLEWLRRYDRKVTLRDIVGVPQ